MQNYDKFLIRDIYKIIYLFIFFFFQKELIINIFYLNLLKNIPNFALNYKNDIRKLLKHELIEK